MHSRQENWMRDGTREFCAFETFSGTFCDLNILTKRMRKDAKLSCTNKLHNDELHCCKQNFPINFHVCTRDLCMQINFETNRIFCHQRSQWFLIELADCWHCILDFKGILCGKVKKPKELKERWKFQTKKTKISQKIGHCSKKINN